MSSTAIAVPSQTRTLEAFDAGSGLMPTDGAYRSVLQAFTSPAKWRLVELCSAQGLPFNVRLNWSLGNLPMGYALLTMPTSGRVCVFGELVGVQVANVANGANTVSGSIVNACLETRNFYEWRGRCDGVSAAQIPVPPYAKTVHLHVSDKSLISGTDVDFLDGTLTPRVSLSLPLMPPLGFPLGGTRQINLRTESACDMRAIFSLAL